MTALEDPDIGLPIGTGIAARKSRGVEYQPRELFGGNAMNRLCCIVALLWLRVAPASAIVWEWHCDVDPTTIDSNTDGILDWIERNGNPFDGLTGSGTWRATTWDHVMDNRPRNDYSTPTTVDLTWRSYGEGDWQATFWANVDYVPPADPEADPAGEVFAPVFMHLELMDAGTQTLTLYGKLAAGPGVELAQFTGLRDDFIDTKLYFDTVADTVTVWLDDVEQGTYGYHLIQQNYDNFATVLGLNGEFDYVRIEVEDIPEDRIPEPATLLLVGSGALCLLRRRRRR